VAGQRPRSASARILKRVAPNARWSALILVTLAASMTACGIRIGDPGPPGEVGVSTGDGTILLRFQPCNREKLVNSVAVRVSAEGDTLWKITSESGSRLRIYQVGRTPPGFVETVPRGTINQDESYVVEVTDVSPGLSYLTEFVPSSLQPSIWKISSNKRLTEAEFENLHPCP